MYIVWTGTKRPKKILELDRDMQVVRVFPGWEKTAGILMEKLDNRPYVDIHDADLGDHFKLVV